MVLQLQLIVSLKKLKSFKCIYINSVIITVLFYNVIICYSNINLRNSNVSLLSKAESSTSLKRLPISAWYSFCLYIAIYNTIHIYHLCQKSNLPLILLIVSASSSSYARCDLQRLRVAVLLLIIALAATTAYLLILLLKSNQSISVNLFVYILCFNLWMKRNWKWLLQKISHLWIESNLQGVYIILDNETVIHKYKSFFWPSMTSILFFCIL